MYRPKLRARLDFSRQCISIFDVAQSTPGLESPPLYCIEQSDAQVLMDDLWNAGVRPTEGAGTAGSMAVVQTHLAHVTDLLDTVLPYALRKS